MTLSHRKHCYQKTANDAGQMGLKEAKPTAIHHLRTQMANHQTQVVVPRYWLKPSFWGYNKDKSLHKKYYEMFLILRRIWLLVTKEGKGQ